MRESGWPDGYDRPETNGVLPWLGRGMKLFGLSLFSKKPSPPVPDVNTLYQQALAFQQQGNLDQAIRLFMDILAMLPANPDLQRLLGVAECQRGNLDQGLSWLNKALAGDSANPFLHVNIGLACYKLGRQNEALLHLQKTISLDPNCIDGYFNLGNLQTDLGNYREANLCFDECIKLRGGAEDYYNKGQVLQRQGKLLEAESFFCTAIEKNDSRSENYVALGNVRYEKGDYLNALTAYEQAIQLDSACGSAYWNKSITNLLLGNYEQGWVDFQWRPGAERLLRDSDTSKLWLGDFSIDRKTVLIVSEHGLGDTMQFARYIEYVLQQGANVVFEVQPSLVELMKASGMGRVIPQGCLRPAYDFYCPLLSLPLACKSLQLEIPGKIPYLNATPDKTRFWSDKLSVYQGLKVGLVWSGGFHEGNPEHWAVNARRNIPLAEFSVLNMEGVVFFSLQKGQLACDELREQERTGWSGPKIHDFTDQLNDFSDTAAFVANLDLIISVDTSVVHLAGGLGKTVWLLNRFDTCWRWLLNRSDSPWYPDATIFRQSAPGDWTGVMEDVRERLELSAAPLRIS